MVQCEKALSLFQILELFNARARPPPSDCLPFKDKMDVPCKVFPSWAPQALSRLRLPSLAHCMDMTERLQHKVRVTKHHQLSEPIVCTNTRRQHC